MQIETLATLDLVPYARNSRTHSEAQVAQIAEQTARRCYAMELSPNYVDVAVRRWQQFTGKTAVHAGTGAAFSG